ncbi:hypothetical protein [Agromyces bracchium]|uniref:Uncharacterized protein n=1 Tax=Agromyces bracchium TaxID=88376 RepID=A0A6I3M4V2_9MICO|nr:hypothetical protein [Agromyces bracchium]MTH67112.1 hypothetical protein [Agromyces bracchium]
MGLMDDAGEMLASKAERERAAREESERQAPWTDDWTMELTGLLIEAHIPARDIFVSEAVSDWKAAFDERGVRGWTRTEQSNFWGRGWALMGWKYSTEWGPSPVRAILDQAGGVWELLSGSRIVTLRGSTETLENGRTVRHPARTASSEFFLVDGLPRIPTYTLSGVGRSELRESLGIPVAAAVAAGVQPLDGWLRGIQH